MRIPRQRHIGQLVVLCGRERQRRRERDVIDRALTVKENPLKIPRVVRTQIHRREKIHGLQELGVGIGHLRRIDAVVRIRRALRHIVDEDDKARHNAVARLVDVLDGLDRHAMPRRGVAHERAAVIRLRLAADIARADEEVRRRRIVLVILLQPNRQLRAVIDSRAILLKRRRRIKDRELHKRINVEAPGQFDHARSLGLAHQRIAERRLDVQIPILRAPSELVIRIKVFVTDARPLRVATDAYASDNRRLAVLVRPRPVGGAFRTCHEFAGHACRIEGTGRHALETGTRVSFSAQPEGQRNRRQHCHEFLHVFFLCLFLVEN